MGYPRCSQSLQSVSFRVQIACERPTLLKLATIGGARSRSPFFRAGSSLFVLDQ